MTQLIILIAACAVAGAVALVVSRRGDDAPQQGASWAVPTQVDRQDFPRPDAPWLVIEFSSATCLSCQGVWAKVEVLESEAVAVANVEAIAQKALHERYQVDAVPMVLVVDAEGAVRRSFVGEPTATDLWAGVAELREPGSVPPGCTGH